MILLFVLGHVYKLYSPAITCAMCYPIEGSDIFTKRLSCQWNVVPDSASYWPIYLPLYHVLRSLLSIKTIHLYPFQQTLYRPTFPSSTVPENPVIDSKIIDLS